MGEEIQNIFEKIIVDEKGEVILKEKEVSTKKIISSEPQYIKLYLEDILVLSDLSKTFSPLLSALLKRATNANKKRGLCVSMTAFDREEILLEINWKKMQSLYNAMGTLCKRGILKKLGTGVYQFNPYFFGKGTWKDIENIRAEWEYNCVAGKTFSAKFTYKKSSKES